MLLSQWSLIFRVANPCDILGIVVIQSTEISYGFTITLLLLGEYSGDIAQGTPNSEL